MNVCSKDLGGFSEGEQSDQTSRLHTRIVSHHSGSGGMQGKIMAPAFRSNAHFTYWQSMRPLVQCDDKSMTFTASGEGVAHLLVDRGKMRHDVAMMDRYS